LDSLDQLYILVDSLEVGPGIQKGRLKERMRPKLEKGYNIKGHRTGIAGMGKSPFCLIWLKILQSVGNIHKEQLPTESKVGKSLGSIC
jgi:hypothetical protein